MEPAKTVIARLGGAKHLALMLGLHRTSVYRWTQPSHIGGTNGLVPAKYQASILRLAMELGAPLSSEDFILAGGSKWVARCAD